MPDFMNLSGQKATKYGALTTWQESTRLQASVENQIATVTFKGDKIMKTAVPNISPLNETAKTVLRIIS